MNDQELKALKALVLVQGALIESLVWKVKHDKEMRDTFTNSYSEALKQAGSGTSRDAELATAMDRAYRSFAAKLAI